MDAAGRSGCAASRPLPKVAIVVDHHHSQAPSVFETNGWVIFRQFERDKDRWYVFARPAAPNGAMKSVNPDGDWGAGGKPAF
jgi:hypothetical protein